MEKRYSVKTPLVSVIIVSYNSANYILETLESAKKQTYKNLELIISDDCSKDSTLEVCRKWIEVNGERFLKTEIISSEINTGVAANLNRGIKAARGEWIKTVAGDDILMDSCIADNINFVAQKKGVLIVHSNVRRFNKEDIFNPENRNKLMFNQNTTEAKKQFQILLRFPAVYAPATFFNKNLFDTFCFFDEKIRLFEDLPMWLHLTKQGVRFWYLDKVTVMYRVSENSIQAKINNSKIYSEFSLKKERFLKDNYYHFFPFIERIIKYLEYYRRSLFDKIGLNKDIWLIKLFDTIASYPFKVYLAKQKKQYK